MPLRRVVLSLALSWGGSGGYFEKLEGGGCGFLSCGRREKISGMKGA